MQFKSMEPGYPRLDTSDDRAVFTLRFQKSNSIFYDPTVDIGKGTSCVYRQSSGNKYNLVTQTFSSSHQKVTNEIASKLNKFAETNGVEDLVTFDKNTIGKCKEQAITYPNGGMLVYRVATDNDARDTWLNFIKRRILV